MSEYYAVERTGDSLQHYGVKGMKWGVRKAIASGNAKALGRQYKKAARKLAKLEKRGASGKKYAKRAALYGAGAAAAGAAAAGGTIGFRKATNAVGSGLGIAAEKVGNAMSKYSGKGSRYVKSAGKAINRAGADVETAILQAGQKAGVWGRKELNIAKNAPDNVRKYLTNDAAVRAGAGLVGLGLAGAAAKNTYRAATAKRNRKKAAEFRSEMQKAFKGTEYANKMPAQYIPKQKKRKKSSNHG